MLKALIGNDLFLTIWKVQNLYGGIRKMKKNQKKFRVAC